MVSIIENRAFVEGVVRSISENPVLKDYLLIFMIAVPGTFLAYIFNAYGIKVLSASTAGAYIYSQPVFAVAIAMIFLKEELHLHKILAALLIFTGVYLSNRKVKIEKPEKP